MVARVQGVWRYEGAGLPVATVGDGGRLGAVGAQVKAGRFKGAQRCVLYTLALRAFLCIAVLPLSPSGAGVVGSHAFAVRFGFTAWSCQGRVAVAPDCAGAPA